MGDTLRTLATTLAVQMPGSMALLTLPVLAPAAALPALGCAAWLWLSHRSARRLQLKGAYSS